MNYKEKPYDVESLIDDIEYLRRVGRFPWNGASGRRAMEKRFTYDCDFVENGHHVEASVSTGASCNYTRFSVSVSIDGERQARYIQALKKVAAHV